MQLKIIAGLIAVVCLGALSVGEAQAKDRPEQVSAATRNARAVDQLFAQWAKPHSPGASIAVIQNGKVIYARGYGEANLEYGVPNTPDTVFHLASVSKQFTAFSIYLLAQDGKLSLDDDVHKFLPQLHDFGKPITIRQLLHHTSGFREQFNLLALAGWRADDEITDDDIAGLLFRQTQLNFPPGDQFLYSNSGYTLLAMVVKQVSGQSLADFAKARIFDPLGMTHTHFQSDYRTVVKDRAYSYTRGLDGNYQYFALSYSTVGPTSLFSTVGDLAKWDENFYTGAVGGLALLSQMQEKGKLNDGREISYASGLGIGEVRGLRTVSHNGSDAGYRTETVRFPDQHFSVVVLANAGDVDPDALCIKIAEIYLNGSMKPAPPAPPPRADLPEVKVDPEVLDSYVGEYEQMPGFIISYTRDNDHLISRGAGQPPFETYAVSDTAFRYKAFPSEVDFDAPAQGGKAQTATLHHNGADYLMKRVEVARPSAARLKAYEGQFYSAELGVIYEVLNHAGALEVRYPRGDIPLEPAGVDAFGSDGVFNLLKFECTGDGACNAFTVDDSATRNVRFVKVAAATVGAKPPDE